jgi:hypothetical protein
MTDCTLCGGYGNRHDPIAHGAEPTWDGRMTHDDIAEIAFSVIQLSHEQGITDPLRLAHAIAFAIKFAESDQ